MPTGFRRYAVYFAPRPDSALGRFGAAWLGWDADAGREVAALDLHGLPRPRAEIVAAPRRYGFHATLKAPFRLAEGAEPGALDAALGALAAEFAPFDAPLALSAIDAFLALTLATDVPELDAIAAACVTRLDQFRAPSLPEEIARRNLAALVGRQSEHLAAWGYPYVLDEFRFHLTLTSALPPAEQAATRAALDPVLAPMLAQPLAFEDLCLFGEAGDGRFHVLRRRRLRGR